MDLSKLTAQELKVLCRQYQEDLNEASSIIAEQEEEINQIFNRNFWGKLKYLLTNK